MLLVGQEAPIELAYRIPRPIKSIFGRAADDKIQGSRIVVGELYTQAPRHGNQAGQAKAAADFECFGGA
jgi:hypothetical protein